MRVSCACAGLVAALCVGRGNLVAAQANGGTITGRVLDVRDQSPVAFALIRLSSADSAGTTVAAVLTDSGGRYLIAGVPPRTYLLQVDRIGFERIASPPQRVGSGGLVYDFQTTPVAVRLSTVRVLPAGRCVGLAQLDEDSQLAALWREAVKGVETRRAFELQYRFTRILDQTVKFDRRFMPDVSRRNADTTISEPDSVAARRREAREAHRTAGYGSSVAGRFALPDETEVLDDDFLRDHCLETAPETTDGAVAIRFRAVDARPSVYDIRGTILLDEHFQIRRLQFEHVKGDTVAMRSSVTYADLPVEGVVIRLPSRGEAAGRPPGLALINSAKGTFTFQYSNFERPKRP